MLSLVAGRGLPRRLAGAASPPSTEGEVDRARTPRRSQELLEARAPERAACARCTGRAASRPRLGLYRRLPSGTRSSPSSAREVTEALGALAGHRVRLGLAPGGRPGRVHGLSAGGTELTVRLDRQGARLQRRGRGPDDLRDRRAVHRRPLRLSEGGVRAVKAALSTATPRSSTTWPASTSTAGALPRRRRRDGRAREGRRACSSAAPA